MGSPGTPTDLPMLLLGGFHQLITALHVELARQGHAQARPVHGFALQAVGRDGCSVTELGRTLGVSKQAAAKTATSLERLGYVARSADPLDARSVLLRRTPQGEDLLRRSGRILTRLRKEWIDDVGVEAVVGLEGTLRAVRGSVDNPPLSVGGGWYN